MFVKIVLITDNVLFDIQQITVTNLTNSITALTLYIVFTLSTMYTI